MPTPIVPDLRPLTLIEDPGRGNTRTLHSSKASEGGGHGVGHGGHGRGGLLDVAEFNPICVRGELIGVVLAIREEDASCCGGTELPGEILALPAVRAHVQWGIGAASFSAVVDYLNGTQLGIIAENVRVCAEYVVLGGCANSCDLPCYSVSAGFGYGGVRGHNSNSARLTEFACIEAPGDRVRIRVPPFAISMTVLPIDDQPCGVDVVGRCNSHRVHYDVTVPLANNRTYSVENALPLFNGAHSVLVENKAAGPMAAFVIFGLSL